MVIFIFRPFYSILNNHFQIYSVLNTVLLLYIQMKGEHIKIARKILFLLMFLLNIYFEDIVMFFIIYCIF